MHRQAQGHHRRGIVNEHITDDELVEAIKAGLELNDPVPTSALEAAKAAFTWRTIDAELAELVYDSAESGLVGVRGEAARQVTFRSPGVEIEVMVIDERARRIVGQLVPPQQATVEVHTSAGVREQGSDSLGRFSFEGIAPGPVKLSVQTADGGTVVTEWTII